MATCPVLSHRQQFLPPELPELLRSFLNLFRSNGRRPCAPRRNGQWSTGAYHHSPHNQLNAILPALPDDVAHDHTYSAPVPPVRFSERSQKCSSRLAPYGGRSNEGGGARGSGSPQAAVVASSRRSRSRSSGSSADSSVGQTKHIIPSDVPMPSPLKIGPVQPGPSALQSAGRPAKGMSQTNAVVPHTNSVKRPLMFVHSPLVIPFKSNRRQSFSPGILSKNLTVKPPAADKNMPQHPIGATSSSPEIVTALGSSNSTTSILPADNVFASTFRAALTSSTTGNITARGDRSSNSSTEPVATPEDDTSTASPEIPSSTCTKMVVPSSLAHPKTKPSAPVPVAKTPVPPRTTNTIATTSPSVHGSDSSSSESDTDTRAPLGAPPVKIRGKHRDRLTLIGFLYNILFDQKYSPRIIQWEDIATQIFRIMDTQEVARIWGLIVRKPNMTYDTLSRSLRLYYAEKILIAVPNRQLVFKIGPAFQMPSLQDRVRIVTKLLTIEGALSAATPEATKHSPPSSSSAAACLPAPGSAATLLETSLRLRQQRRKRPMTLTVAPPVITLDDSEEKEPPQPSTVSPVNVSAFSRQIIRIESDEDSAEIPEPARKKMATNTTLEAAGNVPSPEIAEPVRDVADAIDEADFWMDQWHPIGSISSAVSVEAENVEGGTSRSAARGDGSSLGEIFRDGNRSAGTRSDRKESRSPDGASCKPVLLWQFVVELLRATCLHSSSRCVEWIDQKSGVFRIVQPDRFAQLWGQKSGHANVTYETISRYIRLYSSGHIVCAQPETRRPRSDAQRLIFQFGPQATGWQMDQ
ncbi:hypothetical protein BV898_10745 [Hypsibius exemplaris]|uniref:ETS domain-containing protein n=1 Tax=Hypsibius exemplaris TaxID=2072580 RepID=A0A1W0WIR7_HYPEX|nr:hypothetical protein BV898_10745 [Hypsibius exemplaris]